MVRNSDFFIPRFSTVCYGKLSLRYFGPLLWSKLSNKDRGLASLSALKQILERRAFPVLSPEMATNVQIATCAILEALLSTELKLLLTCRLIRVNTIYFIVTIIQGFVTINVASFAFKFLFNLLHRLVFY